MHLCPSLCSLINLYLLPLFIPKGGGRTEHYGKVHAGNKSTKFCNKSAAHKRHVDNKRKRIQRSEAKSRARVEACQTTRMKPLTSYFVSETYSLPAYFL
jgi:hypothetical protein